MNAPARIPLHEEMDLANRVADALVAAGITPEDDDYAELMASETDIQNRLLRILRVARLTEAHSAAIKQLADDMKARRDRLDTKAERLRGIVLQAMSDLGLKKLEGADLSASLSAGKPKVQIIDPNALPDDVCAFRREPSKTAIAAALAEGPVPGASWSNPQPVLTIRSR